jgi:hypothetical protein
LIGANMSFRRAVFERVGGFRARLSRVGARPVGCHETELCIRVTQRWPGSLFFYEPTARVRHKVPAARARWSYFRARCYAEGRSKALMARCVGSGRGLAAERTYTLRTLPLAAVQSLADWMTGHDRAGFARATAIALGLGVTTAGYLTGLATTCKDRPGARDDEDAPRVPSIEAGALAESTLS